MAKLYTKTTWEDELLSGDPRYDILEDDDTPYKADMQINLATSVVTAGTPADAANMNNIENGIDAIDTRADITNLTAKTSLADADETNIVDSAASGAHKKITWANIKAAIWSAIHAATSKSTPVDADELPLLDSAGSYGINRLTLTNLKAFLKTYFDGLYVDGWIDPGETWTYASATTFTVPGNQTAKYIAGVKIKLTQTTPKYFYVVSSSYGAPNTTVTVTGGSDYTIANAAITSPYYSRSERPAGFPDIFNYTLAWTSDGSAPSLGNAVVVSRFRISGKHVDVKIQITFGNTSSFGSGNYSFSLPLTSANDGANNMGFTYVSDASVSGTSYPYFAAVLSNSAVITYFVDSAASGTARRITPTSPITLTTSDAIIINVRYPFAA